MPGTGSAFLTDEEKARIRYHFGYLNVQPVISIALGVPAATQPEFLLEAAMNRILPAAVGIMRNLVAQMDLYEQKLSEVADYLIATQLGEITLNPESPDLLEREYCRWAMRASDFLGAPLNPYSKRWGGMGPALSVRRAV